MDFHYNAKLIRWIFTLWFCRRFLWGEPASANVILIWYQQYAIMRMAILCITIHTQYVHIAFGRILIWIGIGIFFSPPKARFPCAMLFRLARVPEPSRLVFFCKNFSSEANHSMERFCKTFFFKANSFLKLQNSSVPTKTKRSFSFLSDKREPVRLKGLHMQLCVQCP